MDMPETHLLLEGVTADDVTTAFLSDVLQVANDHNFSVKGNPCFVRRSARMVHHLPRVHWLVYPPSRTSDHLLRDSILTPIISIFKTPPIN